MHNAVVSWTSVANQIKSELKINSKPERAVFEKRYLKSDLEFLGATVPAVRKCAKKFAKEHKGLTRRELRALVGEMWKTRIHEVRSVAVALLDHFSSLLRPSDLSMIRKRIADAAGWAHVDWLAVNVSGSIVLDHPESLQVLLLRLPCRSLLGGPSLPDTGDTHRSSRSRTVPSHRKWSYSGRRSDAPAGLEPGHRPLVHLT